QLLMREILMQDAANNLGTSAELAELGSENYVELLKYTTIVVSTLPIICIYPFLQKYFVKGVLVGSLKE
ncbi:MAG: carbohydrate ABC transporter permease, partial [Clostridia bacterium]